MEKITSTVGLNGKYAAVISITYVKCISTCSGSCTHSYELGTADILGLRWPGRPSDPLGQGELILRNPLSDNVMFSVALQYYSECQGVIYVIDSCDPENLAISAQTFSELSALLVTN